MALMKEILWLPRPQVVASVGLAFDLGSTQAKLVYRSNTDFANGELIHPDKWESDVYPVHLVRGFPASDLDDVITYILAHADIKRVDADDTPVVNCTGMTSVSAKDRLESELSVKLNQTDEFESLVLGFMGLATHREKQHLFTPHPGNHIEDAISDMRGSSWFFSSNPTPGFVFHYAESDTEPEVEDDGKVLPCILIMAGTGISFQKINEDGSWVFLDSQISNGGKHFVGLCSMVADKRDFNEIISLIDSSSGETVDKYVADIMPHITAEGNILLAMAGKAAERPRSEMSEGDMLHSIYHSMCMNLAQLGHLHARLAGVKKIYFCGNMINSQAARQFLFNENFRRNHMYEKDDRIEVGFLQHGGHLGAIGLFLS